VTGESVGYDAGGVLATITSPAGYKREGSLRSSSAVTATSLQAISADAVAVGNKTRE
jgi:hypothetical protein